MVLATLMRPVGGRIADRIRAGILAAVFAGLGGFFPPLVLGLLQDHVGSYAPGVAFLALCALAAFALNAGLFLIGPTRRTVPRTA